MTKEELEKEAGDYADKHAFRVPYDGSNKFYDDVDFKASKEGYLAGAEPREKRIEELETENNKLLDVINNQDVKIADLGKQIEKMKCCGNCLHQYEGSYKNGVRCKDHLDEEVCNDWEI